MLSTEKIQEIVLSSFAQSPHGTAAHFIPLNDKWAIKLYKSAGRRDFAHYFQTKAFCYDLGPETGDKIDLPCGTHQFGYITEIVEPILPEAKNVSECIHSKKGNDWLKNNQEELKILNFLLGEDVFYFCDEHAGNFGYRNGALVLIDFDKGETSEEELQANGLKKWYMYTS